ncbi:hypothetical protein IE4872_PD02117 (plasmid) [Rhizobium gallicum]|uniref:Uncharacterized protein n=1 Tax=Rhizobium gallicum TaxID=56730 RepID=A0A1L5NXK7_9HYPH|nr:hypothetical protein IE4872_PD02117 [Rhizobium gallicum]
MIGPSVRNCTPERFPSTAAWADPRPLHRRFGCLLLALTVLATDGPLPRRVSGAGRRTKVTEEGTRGRQAMR